MSRKLKSLLIAAPATGSGKTTVTLALMVALRKRGLRVQPFKVGPDYIDPAWHVRVCGRPGINLDPWLTSEAFVRETFAYHTRDADVAIIEGVMGLFDSAGQGGEFGSTAHVAKLLDLPVLLVLDAAASAESLAAVALGCETFDPALRIAGFLLNRIGGESHRNSIESAIHSRCKARVIGAMGFRDDLKLPERQLGLVSVHERGLNQQFLDELANWIERSIDIGRLIEELPAIKISPDAGSEPKAQASVCTPTIGVARDEVFCFYYEDNLRLLREAGAELIPFSPLHDEVLPENLGGLYLGGGFPEEFAPQLSENLPMLAQIREFPGAILAECGGLMYLCEQLVDLERRAHPMAARVPGTIEMTGRLQGFGYRDVMATRETILGPTGTRLRGHEFHFSHWAAGDEPKQSALGEMRAYADERIFASYLHVHFGSMRAAMHRCVCHCSL